MATASTAVYQSVSRIRTESLIIPAMVASPVVVEIAARSGTDGDHIARAPPGVDERRLLPGVHLLPQPADVDVDDVREGVEAIVPHVLGELGPPDDPPGVA